jgi:DNA mismatch endonuclease, patch repair protein
MNMLQRLAPRGKRQALTRSQIMARIRSANTHPERAVCEALFAKGIRFRKNVKDLPGKPDLANKARKWAIFVHGCFWHSHENCNLASQPKTNGGYWQPKLERIKERDRLHIAALRHIGYRVFVLWECDVRNGRIPARLFTSLLGGRRTFL